MLKLAIVSRKPQCLSELAEGFLRHSPGADILWCRTGEEALAAAAQSAPQLVVVDEDLGALSTRQFLRRLVAVNATINTAVVSRLPPEEFHEHFEGLGVLAQLPPRPDSRAGADLAARLQAVFPGF